jgi:hypothetical protein
VPEVRSEDAAGRVIVTTCRDCTASIVWCVTPNDKKMPVNADTSGFGGNIVMLDPDNDTPMIRVLAKGEDAGGLTRYKSHFTTCANAKGRRKPR